MKTTLTPEDLARLGLTGDELGAPERIDAAADASTSLAFSKRSLPSLDELLRREDDLNLEPIPTQASEALEVWSASDDGHVLMVYSAQPLSVLGDQAGAVVQRDDHTVYLDRRHFKHTVALLTERLEGLCVLPVGQGEDMVPIVSMVRSDLEAWHNDAQDAWLKGEIMDRLRNGSAWHHVVAMGLSARLAQAQDPAAIVARLMRGLPVPSLDRERAWARSRSAAVWAAIEAQAVSEADALLEELEALFERMDVEDPDWRGDVLGVLRRRDDVEGVLLLLREAGEGDALLARLADVDPACHDVVHAMPRWRGADQDERLRRVRALIPEAWWAVPATW